MPNPIYATLKASELQGNLAKKHTMTFRALPKAKIHPKLE